MDANFEEVPQQAKFQHRTWDIVPDSDHPDSFSLTTTKGDVVCTLTFPENGDPTLLQLIASAPELQDIVEMYHDSMVGNKAEKTMVFSIVRAVLDRLRY